MEIILPLLLVLFAGFMFMNARRQRRQYQEVQRMQSSLSPGDEVMTTSGLYGTIVGTTDDTIDLEIAPDVRTRWIRQAIREKVKPEIADDAAELTALDQDVVEDGPKADGR